MGEYWEYWVLVYFIILPFIIKLPFVLEPYLFHQLPLCVRATGSWT